MSEPHLSPFPTAFLFDISFLRTIGDLSKDSLSPLTAHRPPEGRSGPAGNHA